MLLKTRLLAIVAMFTLVFALASVQSANAQGMPAAPKVSTFAPAEDLANQLKKYLVDLEEATKDEASYKDAGDNIAKQANTVIVIALALGLHDQENEHKARAGAMMQAAKNVAAAKDFASTQKAVLGLKDAAKGNGAAGGALKWETVASLPELMKQVPNINVKLKMNIKDAKFKSKAKDTQGYTAVLAVIAQAAMADTAGAKADTPAKVQQWYDWSVKARDYAGEMNAAIHAGKKDAADEAMKKMAQNCDDCHAVFNPSATPANAGNAAPANAGK
jgi:hypothetical protein